PAAGFGGHGSIATAVDLGRLSGLTVPNTILNPADPFFGQTLSVAAAAVVGSIVANPKSEDDYYAFQAEAGEVYHAALNSFDLARVANPIDSVLRIVDAQGNPIAYADDEFETPDAVVVDWEAPAAGTYYLVVDTFAAAQDKDAGDYELFLYRAAAGPNLGLGDTI